MNRKAYRVCKRFEGWRIDTGNGSIVLKEGDILVFYDILLVKVISGVSSFKRTLCINNPSFIGDLEEDIGLDGTAIHTYGNVISRKREYVISFYGVRSGTNMYDMLTDVTISCSLNEERWFFSFAGSLSQYDNGSCRDICDDITLSYQREQKLKELGI